MAARLSNLEGQQFGQLVALKRLEKSTHNKTRVWLCRCLACGKEVELPSTKLKNLEQQTCGCLRSSPRTLRSPKGHSGFTVLLSHYKFAARSRNLSWHLSDEQFRDLVTANCTYCNQVPSAVQIGSKGHAREHGKFIHNGVDRIDSSLGYEPTNCVPCCKTCNIAKSTLTVSEFRDWIVRVYMNFA